MSFTPAAAANLRQAVATVVAVPVTPFLPDGNPDWDTYAALTGRLIDGGITVITPNGNTGEFYALSPAEARQAAETAARTCRGRGQGTELLAGVGHDIATAVEAAGHARDWEKVRRFEELRAADDVSVVKEALWQLGLCAPDVRPPSRLLPPAIKQEIKQILTSWGLT